MQEDIEILDIYNEIKSNRLEYCKICLRNENETKLVNSMGLKLLLGELRSKKNEFPSSMTLCYMCNARASSAAAFLAAIDFACDIRLLFESLDTNPYLQTQLKRCINRSKRVRGKSLVDTLVRCERDLKAIQGRNQFIQSKVLVVDSDNRTQRKKQNLKSKDTSNSKPPEIVISDDEEDHGDDTYIPVITAKPIEELLDKQPTVRSSAIGQSTDQDRDRDQTEPNFTETEPNFTETEPNVTETEPNVTINNNNLVISNPQQILTPAFPFLIPTHTSVIHPIYQDANGTILIPTLGGQIDKQGNFIPIEKVTVGNNSIDSLIETSLIVRNEIESNNVSNNKEEDVLEVNGLRRESRDEGLDSNEMSSIRIESVVSNKSDKDVPVLTGQSSVDWEDKIPMDVISLMNPEPNTLVETSSSNQSICAIENVRSVR